MAVSVANAGCGRSEGKHEAMKAGRSQPKKALKCWAKESGFNHRDPV